VLVAWLGLEHTINLLSHAVGLVLERAEELGKAVFRAGRVGIHGIDSSLDGVA
jgi:hypothetical protein